MSDEKKKREIALILERFPCDCNFFSDGPRTLHEANELGPQVCSNIANCGKGTKCVMSLAACLARDMINGGTERMTLWISKINSKEGFYWYNGKIFVLLEENEAKEKIPRFARELLEG